MQAASSAESVSATRRISGSVLNDMLGGVDGVRATQPERWATMGRLRRGLAAHVAPCAAETDGRALAPCLSPRHRGDLGGTAEKWKTASRSRLLVTAAAGMPRTAVATDADAFINPSEEDHVEGEALMRNGFSSGFSRRDDRI